MCDDEAWMFPAERLRYLLRHEVVKNAALLYGVQFGSYVFPLLTLPYLSRVLNPAGLGLVAFAQSFIAYFVLFTDYGFNLSATRRVAVERGDLPAVSKTFSSVMLAKSMLCGISFVVMVGVVAIVPRLRGDWPLYFVSFLMVVGDLLFPIWLYQGLQTLRQVAVRDIGARFLSLLAIFIFVRTQHDYVIAAGIQSGSYLVAGLFGLLMVPRLTKVRFHFTKWPEIKERLREGAPVFLSMAAITLYGSTNIFIMGLVSKPEEVGYFSTAQRVVMVMRTMVAPLVGALYPKISHMASQSPARAVQFLRKYSLILSIPFFAAGVFLLVAAYPIERILFGPKFVSATLPLQIMSFSPFLLCLSHSFTTYYMLAFGFDRQWTRLTAWGTVLNFTVLVPLLMLVRPSVAVALTMTILDVYVVIASYLFYLKTSPAILQREEPALSPPVLGKETIQ